tara:strand:- start:728 stop:1558 length:831 start_codon:yes stop_codon:yes gene_type:complete
MQYHNTLQTLVGFIQKLTFQNKDRKISYARAFPEQNIAIIYECEIYNSCNGLHLDDFNKRIKGIVREIEDSIDDSLVSKGAEYKKEIRQVVKSLNRLKQDYFNDNRVYIGDISHIDGKVEMLELIVDGKYVDYLCDKYRCEDYMIFDTKGDSKPLEFYKSIYSRLISLEQSLSFLYTESDNIVEHNSVKENLIEKIDWNGTPAHLAYIFQELVNKDFITLPRSQGDISYSKLARLCNEFFEFKGTLLTLERVMRNPECLAKGNRDQFNIPFRNEIS